MGTEAQCFQSVEKGHHFRQLKSSWKLRLGRWIGSVQWRDWGYGECISGRGCRRYNNISMEWHFKDLQIHSLKQSLHIMRGQRGREGKAGYREHRLPVRLVRGAPSFILPKEGGVLFLPFFLNISLVVFIKWIIFTEKNSNKIKYC